MRTFAIPLEKMSGIFYRPAQVQGTVEIIEKTEGKYKKQVPNKQKIESVNSKRLNEARKIKKYTKKSLILAQDER